MICIKCGQQHWEGPLFIPERFPNSGFTGTGEGKKEHILYKCKVCGYQREEETWEQQQARDMELLK